MSVITVTFNGHDLTSEFVASRPRIQGMPVDIGSVEVPGMDGSLFTGARLGPKTIGITLTAKASTFADRRDALRKLFGYLRVDEPKALAFSFDNGLFYLAVPTTTGDIGFYRRHASIDVEFVAHDPAMYSAEVTKTVPSGSSVTFTVDGNYPTRPTISASAAKRGSGGFWRLDKNSGEQKFTVTLPNNNTTVIAADCGSRVLTVAGNVSMLDPSSDWLVLKPGRNTIAMTGTGAATIKYRERWLR